MLEEPLSDAAARALIRQIIVDRQRVRFTRHAYEEMDKDSMDEQDAFNVLRGGTVQGCDFEHGTWRYRVITPKFVVVVAFRSETQLTVVTAWRNK